MLVNAPARYRSFWWSRDARKVYSNSRIFTRLSLKLLYKSRRFSRYTSSPYRVLIRLVTIAESWGIKARDRGTASVAQGDLEVTWHRTQWPEYRAEPRGRVVRTKLKHRHPEISQHIYQSSAVETWILQPVYVTRMARCALRCKLEIIFNKWSDIRRTVPFKSDALIERSWNGALSNFGFEIESKWNSLSSFKNSDTNYKFG